MIPSEARYVQCDGGLVLDRDKFTIMAQPNVARILKNFEVSTGGGYRRINGFTKFGGGSATQPTGGSADILGVHPYALGIVVAVSDDVYYTEDGISWTQINKDTTETGVVVGSLSGLSTLARTSAGKTRFTLVKGEENHATNPYGVLYIASDGGPKVAHFHITGTGGSRTFHYVELSTPSAGALVENHAKHLCVVDTTNAPNTVYYSDTNDHDDFIGAGSGSITVSDIIVGIKSFREDLYVFCKNSIHKVENINDPTTISMTPVTNNLGCITGDSIQEIGGDLIFLGPDGFRNVAGTARIDDVDISTVSNSIQPAIEDFVSGLHNYVVSSVVIREKSQYRLFYIDTAGTGKGFIGTLKADINGQLGLQWSEVDSYPVYSIASHYNNNGNEVVYHGGKDGYIFLHDSGNSFNGAAITATYKSPDMHLGDLGMRKTLHYMNVSVENEGAASITVSVNFDFSSTRVVQPAPFSITLTAGGARYGTAVYGTDRYGSGESPLERIPLQGSGHSVSYEFNSSDTNPPYIIHGFHTEVFPSGRK